MASRYRNRQQSFEAVQFVDGRYGEAIDFCPSLVVTFGLVDGARAVTRAMVAGAAIGNGEWIVKGADGAFEIRSDEDFHEEFERA